MHGDGAATLHANGAEFSRLSPISKGYRVLSLSPFA